MTPKAILLCLAKIMRLGAMFTAIQILGSRDKLTGPKHTNPRATRMKILTTVQMTAVQTMTQAQTIMRVMTAVLMRITIQVQTTVKTAKKITLIQSTATKITIVRITNLQAKSPKNESWSFFCA